MRSNEEFMNRLMNFSEHGALVQTVILSSLLNGVQQITKKNKPEKDEHAFICPQLWYDICVDIERQICEEYKA